MRKNNKGFSLVELIVVIAIMAILAAVAVVSYSIYVDRAKEAADKDYIHNVVYFSELYALENELPLAWVEIEPEVNDKDDIKLIIQNPDGTVYAVTSQEVYDAVGNGTITGGLNNGLYQPGMSDPTRLPPEELPTTPCPNHPGVQPTAGETEPPSCTHDGWQEYICNGDQCPSRWLEILPAQHQYEQVSADSRYTYSRCKECGHIRIQGPDGSVIVPIN